MYILVRSVGRMLKSKWNCCTGLDFAKQFTSQKIMYDFINKASRQLLITHASTLQFLTSSCDVPRWSMTILCIRDICTPMSLCIPQHSKQTSTPRFTDNHSGSEEKYFSYRPVDFDFIVQDQQFETYWARTRNVTGRYGIFYPFASVINLTHGSKLAKM